MVVIDRSATTDKQTRQPSTGAGLTFDRRWTRVGVHPYDEITWETRTASIANEKGDSVF